jgi:hypothetical protein
MRRRPTCLRPRTLRVETRMQLQCTERSHAHDYDVASLLSMCGHDGFSLADRDSVLWVVGRQLVPLPDCRLLTVISELRMRS